MNELYRLRARESRPEQERHADRQEPPRVGMRGARGIADGVGDRSRKPAFRDCLLGAVCIEEAKRASDDQAERQQPQEQSIGESPGENARRNASVSLRCPDGDRERHVSFTRALRARHRGREPGARPIGATGIRAFVTILRRASVDRRRCSSLSSLRELGREGARAVPHCSVPAVPAGSAVSALTSVCVAPSAFLLCRSMKKTAASAADVMRPEMISEASG